MHLSRVVATSLGVPWPALGAGRYLKWSGCDAPIRDDLPVSARLIVSKDVGVAVVGIDFEPALRWREPAVDDSTDGKAALPKPES